MMNNTKVENMILGTNKEGIHKNILEEAKKDLEIERNKNETIEGYLIIKRLLKLIPQKYQGLMFLNEKDNSLWFEEYNLGKITDIDYIADNYHLDMCLNTEIIISTTKGQPVRIEFKHGKNEQTKKYDYIDFSIAVGY